MSHNHAHFAMVESIRSLKENLSHKVTELSVTFHPTTSSPHLFHYNDVIMSAMASQIPRVSIVYSTICSGADKRKHQSSALLAFVRGIHRWLMNFLHKGPVTQKMFPIYDVMMLFHLPSAVTINMPRFCSLLNYHYKSMLAASLLVTSW